MLVEPSEQHIGTCCATRIEPHHQVQVATPQYCSHGVHEACDDHGALFTVYIWSHP